MTAIFDLAIFFIGLFCFIGGIVIVVDVVKGREEEKEMIVGGIMIFIGSLLLVACLNTFLL